MSFFWRSKQPYNIAFTHVCDVIKWSTDKRFSSIICNGNGMKRSCWIFKSSRWHLFLLQKDVLTLALSNLGNTMRFIQPRCVSSIISITSAPGISCGSHWWAYVFLKRCQLSAVVYWTSAVMQKYDRNDQVCFHSSGDWFSMSDKGILHFFYLPEICKTHDLPVNRVNTLRFRLTIALWKLAH